MTMRSNRPVVGLGRAASFALLCALPGACCATHGPYTDHRPWLLSASRSFFAGDVQWTPSSSDRGSGMSGTQPAAAFVFFALPIALDVVFLPVAVTHDAAYVW